MEETPGMFVLDVTAENDTPFRVVAYVPGATGPYPAAKDEARSLVEFYDRRYPHTEHGQFTGGRYHVETFLAGWERSLSDPRQRGAFPLNGNSRAWMVDFHTNELIIRWLRALIGNVPAFAAGVSTDQTTDAA